jgi:protoporphyrinogen/coproporphyrinogen III oxidase
MKPHIVVIGGGITGLSAAHRLVTIKKQTKCPLQITLIEASERLGGVVKSERHSDYVIEHGPDSLIDQPAAISLCKELDLETKILPTNERYRKAFVAFQGKLHEIPKGFSMIAPTDFISFATSSLFSVKGKLRALLDLVLPKRSFNIEDETVAEFVQRRLGKEIFERAAQALIGGIYMADLNELSAKASIGRFVELESKHGSIIRGLLKEDRKQLATASGARYSKFITLDYGMQSLVDALSNSLCDERVMTSSKVTSVNFLPDKSWQIKLAAGNTVRADGVIITTPAFQTAKLLSNLHTSLADKLAAVKTTSSAVVNLLFRRADIGHSLNGFGFVVPSIEKRKILACAFISVKFPKRAPANTVMLRVFIGGSFMPEHRELSDDQLKRLAIAEIKPYLKVRGNPIGSWVCRWPNAMPQYESGHLDLVSAIEADINQLAGLKLAGNSYFGVGIPDCITSGDKAAQSLFETVQNHALLPR